MLTVGEMLAVVARTYPDKTALVSDGRTWSFNELDRWANQVAHGLSAAGVKHGDRIAVLSTDNAEYMAVTFASARLGAILVALNYRLHPEELSTLLNHAEPAFLFFAGRYESRLPTTSLSCHPRLACLDGKAAGFTCLEEITAGQPECPPSPTGAVQPEDIATIVYTSGTTGLPKGVMLSHGALFARSMNCIVELGLVPEDRGYTASPLFHIAGMAIVLPMLHRGCTVILLPQYSLESFLPLVADHQVTFAFLVPTMIRNLMLTPLRSQYDLSSLKTIFYGGSPIPLDTLRQAQNELSCSFFQAFGQTEDSPQTFLSGNDHRRFAATGDERLRSAGRPTINVQVRVVGANGEVLPTGQVGDITCRSAQAMCGYWRSPDVTAETLREGWVHTGDLGYLDENNYLHVVDRKKDLIIRGGENIYPLEIEHVLHHHPAVREAAVIGVQSAAWGEEVKAVIVPRDGYQPTEALTADILQSCRQHLASYKVPASIDFMAEMPHTPSGKVMKPRLRELYWKTADRKI